MSTTAINKVDMSLDDIIKVNRTEKRQQARTAKLQGMKAARGNRGVGASVTAASPRRGRGGLGMRGTKRGGAVAISALRGAGVRGRGRGRGVQRGAAKQTAGRGRGSVQIKQNLALSTSKLRGGGTSRGRGGNLRGRGGQTKVSSVAGEGLITQKRQQQLLAGTQVFTNSGLLTNKQTLARQQNQRLNKARKQAALLREKQLAMKNLQQAQKNMQTVNLAIQKTSRDAVVNQMRGLGSTGLPTAKTTGRGRRKLLASLTRQGSSVANFNSNNNSNDSLRSSQAPSRQLNYTSVTISNPSAFNSAQSQRGRRRPWRKPIVPPGSEAFKIEVPNENPMPLPRPPQSTVLEKLKSLKPAVQTTYKFQKNMFAAPTTGVRLSDRFGNSSTSSSSSSSSNHLEERKVFL